MISTTQQPREVFNLLNPAFCGEILVHCIQSYSRLMKGPMPYPLLYLILPLVLHKETRDKLAVKSQEFLHTWIQTNQYLFSDFSRRTKELVPITSDAIVFLLQNNIIVLDSFANVSVTKFEINNNSNRDDEINDCVDKSKTIGRMFARSGSVANIFRVLGVSP